MDQEFATNREEFQDCAYSPLQVATVWPSFNWELGLQSPRKGRTEA